MEKIQFNLTQDSIMELIGAMDSEGYNAFRARIEALNDVTFEDVILFLDRLIGLVTK